MKWKNSTGERIMMQSGTGGLGMGASSSNPSKFNMGTSSKWE